MDITKTTISPEAGRHPLITTIREQAVMLRLGSKQELRGYVFIPEGKRLQDVLNDDRAFLPVRTVAGPVRLINKSSIAEIHEDAATVSKSEANNNQRHPTLWRAGDLF